MPSNASRRPPGASPQPLHPPRRRYMRSRSLPAIVLLLAFAWIGCGDDVESVTVTPDQLRLVVDDTVTLAASARSGDGAIMEEVITWESENPAVATVSASGLV